MRNSSYVAWASLLSKKYSGYRVRNAIATLFVCAAFVVTPAYTQTVSGSIAGSVIDSQEAFIPGATVTATEPEKKFSLAGTTDDHGHFVFAQVPPGLYTISVRAEGFKMLERREVNLSPNDKLDLGNLALSVGAVTDSVEVSSEVVALQTESSERSNSFSARQVQNIAVNGRTFLALVSLAPGVVSTGDFKVSGTGGGTAGINSISANGSRTNQSNLTINGIGAVDPGANGGPVVGVSLDSIQEFKILTGIYQAEYGRAAGAQIAVITKSGTSQFHGSGYWFYRHDSLNANNWLSNRQGLPRQLLRFNTPGYTIGGPVATRRFGLRDKMFFFWSQEFQHQVRPNAIKSVTVPTALERQGDFSQSVDSSGNPYHFIKDPLSTAPCNATNGGGCFNDAGVLGRIPQSRLYQPGLALLKILPLPNAPGNKGFNFQSSYSDFYPRRENTLRLDYNVTSNSRLFGHVLINESQFTSEYGSYVLGSNVPVSPILYTQPGHGYAVGHTLIISPTMTNEFNFGWTGNTVHIDATTKALSRTGSGVNLPVLFPNAIGGDYIPDVSFGGSRTSNSPSFGTSGAPHHYSVNTFDFTDSVSKVMGRHTFKTGAYVQLYHKDQTSFAQNNGVYNFNDNASNPFDTGYSIANAAVGVYNSFTQANSFLTGLYRYTNIEFYGQDTWKITRTLTLDYGLRLALYQPQYDSALQTATFNPSAWSSGNAPRLYQPGKDAAGNRIAIDPVTGQTLSVSYIGYYVPGTGSVTNGVQQAGKDTSRYLMRNRGPQWGPRFGLAWDVTGKQNLVVRTGAGIYYDRIQGNRTFDMLRNPPLTIAPTLNFGFAQDINPNGALLAPPTLYAFDINGKIPSIYNYTFGVQGKLPFHFVLDAAYVGSLSRHLQDNRNLNAVPYGATFLPRNQDPTLAPSAVLGSSALPANFLRPYRGFADINLYESSATSNYNSLQVSLNRRYTSGLFLGISYTWSKALTTASGDGNSFRIDQFTRFANYGPASFDRRQNFVANIVYDFPRAFRGNRIAHAVMDGWQVSGVVRFITGDPFSPGFSISGAGSAQLTGSTTEGARISLIGNPNTGSGNPYNRLNAAAFAAPGPGSIGLDAPVNYVFNPGIGNFDLSIQKNLAVKERLHFQFRVDGFNAFNHTQFSSINSTLNFQSLANSVPTNLPYNASGQLVNPNGFGTVSGVRDPRILQTAIRVQF